MKEHIRALLDERSESRAAMHHLSRLTAAWKDARMELKDPDKAQWWIQWFDREFEEAEKYIPWRCP